MDDKEFLDSLDSEGCPEMWYKNPAGQWVMIGDEDPDTYPEDF